MSPPPSNEDQVVLAPPGAGLPFGEAWVSRHVGFPLVSRLMSWDQAMALFRREGLTITRLAEPLSEKLLQRRVLIRRVSGIEDSSRNWSPAMVLEHLIIVGRQIAEAITLLSNGTKPPGEADVAAVKPLGEDGLEVVGKYRDFMAEYARQLADKVGDRSSATTFAHPWFGEINAHQWCVLGAFHQRIHRRQLERILKH